MTYEIHITETAERDLNGAVDYIEFGLKNPQAAIHLLDEAESQINALSQFPKKWSLAEDKLLASWEIRYMQVHHYLAFFLVSEEEHLVIVVRFLYAKSNWNSLLKLGFPLV